MVARILTWNVRGLGASEKRLLVKQTILFSKADVLILQETKLEIIQDSIIREITGSTHWNWDYLPSLGASGGILILWNDIKVTISNTLKGEYSLSMRCVNVQDGFKWCLPGVYGPNHSSRRQAFFTELNNVILAIPLPWCITEDFNITRCSDEKLGGSRITLGMNRFNHFIGRHRLIDLPLQGAIFTWSSSTAMSRLDRFLLSVDWNAHYRFAIQSALPKIISDHKPILLNLGGIKWGPTPFRFEIMWLKATGFEDLISNWWHSYNFTGSYSNVFWKKMKAPKVDLNKWNVEVFGRIDLKLSALVEQIAKYDQLEELGTMSEQEACDKEDKKQEYQRLALMNEVSWRQKSRMVWLKQGDNNTKFFHAYANGRMKSNSISTLRCDGSLTTDMDIIKSHIIHFYSNLYAEDESWRPVPDQVQFPSISGLESEGLEAIFTDKETFEAISSLGLDKAPGPDGFPLLFFKTFWPIIKFDYLNLLTGFYHSAEFDWKINTTFLLLQPKKHQVEDVKDFSPISLLSSTYKIISKILATRLKPHMCKLISEYQTAYIQGRHITDGVLLANELVDSRLKAGAPGLICKVDMEKAFDRVSWSFIDYILLRMGFGTLWRRWIQACLSFVTFSVLINGAPSGFFKSSRGVRQGDPLSALLFDLASECLSLMLQTATNIGKISGFQVSSVSLPVSHLHYADDTIIFLNADELQLDYVLSILNCFELISGLRINLSKTKIINVGDVPLLQQWADLYGCGVEHLPTSYLGLPLGACQKSIAIWEPILEKIEQRLSKWKGKLLSKEGRLTLIKATLTNLPIYYFSLSLAPVAVTSTIERKIRNFLWSQGRDKKSYHLVQWEQCCRLKENGGLGLKQLKWMNKALLSKWVWRYGMEQESLWHRQVESKFGIPQTVWVPKKSKLSQGTCIWQRIMTATSTYHSHVRFLPSSGQGTRFWLDQWVDGGSLAELYPILFNLSKQKYDPIASFISEDSPPLWNLKFRRALSIDEDHDLTILIAIIGPA